MTFERRLADVREQWEDLTDSERSAFLDQLRESDPDVADALAGKDKTVDQTDENVVRQESTNSDSNTTSTPTRTDERLQAVGGYAVEEEIGRGGMGVVYRVRDPQFERTIALKRMLPHAANHPESRRRFLEEAKLTGQLQHPGIPPAYELGQLDDGSPFFALKLIRGQTLSALLKGSPPGMDAHTLSIFTQVCHTVGYAHSQGVIHRDLKPANIMVGAHGEVQVMDWGLAKVWAKLADELDQPMDAETVRSLQTQDDYALSQTGQVMGTPAYMAREQARGKVRSLDPRCDVFGLGAILCVILTGAPPFRGGQAGGPLWQAMHGLVGEAFDRLDASDADAELVALCKRCLAPDKEKRPKDGGEVADVLETYAAKLRDRLHQADLAQTRAVEERRRRRWTWLATVASMLLLFGGAGGFFWYRQVQTQREFEQAQRTDSIRDALERAASARKALQARLTAEGGLLDMLNARAQWEAEIKVAESAWRRASNLAAERSVSDELTRQIQEMKAKIQRDRETWELADRLETIRNDRNVMVDGTFDDAGSLRKYPKAFERTGVDVLNDPLETVVKVLRRSPLREQLARALDDWAFSVQLKSTPDNFAEFNRNRTRLLEVARLIDPDPWTDRLREPDVWYDRDKLKALAGKLQQFAEANPDPRAVSSQAYVLLGRLSYHHLQAGGDWYQRALARYPTDFWLAFRMAEYLHDQHKPNEAIGYFHTALARRPNSLTALNGLGVTLRDLGNSASSREAYLRAIDIDPEFPQSYSNLGITLLALKDLDGALQAAKKAIELAPHDARFHSNLGMVHYNRSEYDQALAAFRHSLSLEPNSAPTRHNLGNALFVKGQLDEAIRAYRLALVLEPNTALTHYSLGRTLEQNGQREQAVVAYKQATTLDSKLTVAADALARLYERLGRFDDAAKWFAKVLEDPTYAEPYRTSAKNALASCQRNRELMQRLPVTLRGESTSPTEQVELAQLCLVHLRRYRDAVQLYRAAFDSSAKLADDLGLAYRYDAACAATLASLGQGDAESLDADERAKMRRQALDWLRADLKAIRELAKVPAEKKNAHELLSYWREDADLASVRDEKALAMLPEDERQAWQKLWTEVAKTVDEIETSR